MPKVAGRPKGICQYTPGCTKSTGGMWFCLEHRLKMTKYAQNPLNRQKPNARWNIFRSKCKSNGMFYDLTKEQYLQITSESCYYCGESAKTYRGIDRVDSALGYVVTNCLPCCWVCNRAKREMSFTDFIAYIRRLAAHVNAQTVPKAVNLQRI